MKCRNCGRDITKDGNLWKDDSLVFPQYCASFNGVPGGLHQPTDDNLGNLAYYDTFTGLIPCKVTGYDGVNVYFTVTAGRGAYKRGEELSSTSLHVVPRKMVYIRSGQYKINPSYQWVNGVTVYAIMIRRGVA